MLTPVNMMSSAVDAHAHAAGRRHAVLKRAQEVLVELHRLGITAGREQ